MLVLEKQAQVMRPIINEGKTKYMTWRNTKCGNMESLKITKERGNTDFMRLNITRNLRYSIW